jgi:hypothetical protein
MMTPDVKQRHAHALITTRNYLIYSTTSTYIHTYNACKVLPHEVVIYTGSYNKRGKKSK